MHSLRRDSRMAKEKKRERGGKKAHKTARILSTVVSSESCTCQISSE